MKPGSLQAQALGLGLAAAGDGGVAGALVPGQCGPPAPWLLFSGQAPAPGNGARRPSSSCLTRLPPLGHPCPSPLQGTAFGVAVAERPCPDCPPQLGDLEAWARVSQPVPDPGGPWAVAAASSGTWPGPAGRSALRGPGWDLTRHQLEPQLRDRLPLTPRGPRTAGSPRRTGAEPSRPPITAGRRPRHRLAALLGACQGPGAHPASRAAGTRGQRGPETGQRPSQKRPWEGHPGSWGTGEGGAAGPVWQGRRGEGARETERGPGGPLGCGTHTERMSWAGRCTGGGARGRGSGAGQGRGPALDPGSGVTLPQTPGARRRPQVRPLPRGVLTQGSGGTPWAARDPGWGGSRHLPEGHR